MSVMKGNKMPDANGRFKGISVPELPWQRKLGQREVVKESLIRKPLRKPKEKR
jgi:hypothetical protein